jgi:Zn-dependent oligopeptidase
VVTFTLEELEGVPADVISGFTKRTEGSKDVYDVTFKTPDIFPIVSCFVFHTVFVIKSTLQFKFAQNLATRQRGYERYEARLDINVPILSKALDLRRQIAKLLGYPTWADYVTEVKMVKSARGVVEVFVFRCFYAFT